MRDGYEPDRFGGLIVCQPGNALLTEPKTSAAGDLVVSVIKYEDPVGKQFKLVGGKVVGSHSNRSEKAVAETICFSSIEDFATWREALTTEHMLVSGTFDAVGSISVVYKGSEGPGKVSATSHYLAHRERSGIMIIDIDYKDKGEVAGLYLAGGQPYNTLNAAQYALTKVLPEAGGCGLMIGWSTSSNLFNTAGNLVKGTGGIRIYIPVTDASKIPYLLDIMHIRSWLHCEGWAFVAVGGGFEERSLVDLALVRPTQPDFAAPDLRDGLTQDRGWVVHEGNHLDPAIVAPLTAEEETEYRDAVAVAKYALATAMKAEKDRFLDEHTQIAVSKGLNPNTALAAALQCLDNDALYPSVVVNLGGKSVSVFELLTNGSPYDKLSGPDPIERDYNGGAAVSKFFWNEGGFPIISSFAHGQKTYRLRHDEGSMREVIKTRNPKDIARALALSDVDDLTYTVLIGETAKTLGVSPKIIADAVLKERVEMSKAVPEDGTSGDQKSTSVGDVVLINLKEPLSIARKIVATNYTQNGVSTLKRRSGDYFVFDGACYREVSADRLRSEMYLFLETCVVGVSNDTANPVCPDKTLVTKITDALDAVIQMDDSCASPCWLDSDEDHPPADELLICSNGLLHMPSRQIHSLSPALFSLNALDYDFDLSSAEPVQFFGFLDSILGNDLEAQNLLQEMFGYILSGATSYQKILAIVGPKRAGKGVIGRLLTALIGKPNVCSPSLGSFGTNFPLQPLIGKKLALMSDVRLDGRANQKAIVEHMLRVSGEDDVNVARKNKTDWSGRLSARFMLLTNEVPRLADASGAFAGRFVTLVLTKSFYGNENPHLTEKLVAELPGILNWALDGWDRLQNQGHFTVPASSKEVMKELEYLSSPIQKFIDEECFFTPEGGVAVDELFVAWDQWCTSEGRSYPGTKPTLGRDLRAAYPQLQKNRRNIDGRRIYYYEGIVLRNISDPQQPAGKKILNSLAEGGEWFDSIHLGFGPCKVRSLWSGQKPQKTAIGPSSLSNVSTFKI